MPIRTLTMIVGLCMAGALSAPAQDQAPLPAIQPTRFESWRPTTVPREALSTIRVQASSVTSRRSRNPLIGGAIGTIAGLAFCTAFSNLVKDAGTGFSTCTLKGYVLTGGIGFTLGFLIGLGV